jgi:hypothetical protein
MAMKETKAGCPLVFAAKQFLQKRAVQLFNYNELSLGLQTVSKPLHITFGSATQWFLVLRKIIIAQTENTKAHQKPLSDNFNCFQKMECRCAAC